FTLYVSTLSYILSLHDALPIYPEVYGFLRQFEGQQLLVLTNFYDKDTRIAIPEGFTEANILIDNYSDTVLHQSLELKPYQAIALDRKSTRLNSSHVSISYAVFC